MNKAKERPINVCVIHFVNKGIDHLHLPSIFKNPNVIAHLPDVLKEEKHLPIMTTRLDAPIRNKILNYKKVVSDLNIEFENDEYFIRDLPECDCENSQFIDEHHKHIITGDLRVIQNNKLRKLISKGPNYREPRFLNYNKCLTTIKADLKEFVQQLIDRYKLKKDSLDNWVNHIIEILNVKIMQLNNKIKAHQVKPTLKDPNVLSNLNDLHAKFVFVPIDKASNNIAIVCKKFYILKLMKELGISDSPSNTYKISSSKSENIVNLNIQLCKSYDLEVTDKHKTLHIMCWIPKLH